MAPSREPSLYIKPLNKAIVDKFFSASFCVPNKNVVTFGVSWAFWWGPPLNQGAGTALQFFQNDKASGIGSSATVWLVKEVVEALTQHDVQAGPLGPPCGQKFREVDCGQAPHSVKVKLDIG